MIANNLNKVIAGIVPTALYGAEAWGMRSAERKKMNVLEMKYLRSLVTISCRGSFPLH